MQGWGEGGKAKEKQVSMILTDDLTFSCFISSQLGVKTLQY